MCRIAPAPELLGLTDPSVLLLLPPPGRVFHDIPVPGGAGRACLRLHPGRVGPLSRLARLLPPVRLRVGALLRGAALLPEGRAEIITLAADGFCACFLSGPPVPQDCVAGWRIGNRLPRLRHVGTGALHHLINPLRKGSEFAPEGKPVVLFVGVAVLGMTRAHVGFVERVRGITGNAPCFCRSVGRGSCVQRCFLGQT